MSVQQTVFTITISKDEVFEVNPTEAEVDGGSTIRFVSVDVVAKVYIPQPILMPAAGVGSESTGEESQSLVFVVSPGQPVELAAVNENIVCEYFVTRQIFGGFTEGVAIPPQIIIKKIKD